MWDECSQLYTMSQSTSHKEKGQTSVGQSFRILSKSFVKTIHM